MYQAWHKFLINLYNHLEKERTAAHITTNHVSDNGCNLRHSIIWDSGDIGAEAAGLVSYYYRTNRGHMRSTYIGSSADSFKALERSYLYTAIVMTNRQTRAYMDHLLLSLRPIQFRSLLENLKKAFYKIVTFHFLTFIAGSTFNIIQSVAAEPPPKAATRLMLQFPCFIYM